MHAHSLSYHLRIIFIGEWKWGVCGARVAQNGNEENWQRQLELERKRDASSSSSSLPLLLSSFNWQKIRGCPTLRDSIQRECHCLIVCTCGCPCGFEIPSGRNGKLACVYSYCGHSIVIGCDDKIKRKTSNSNLNILHSTSIQFTSLRSPSPQSSVQTQALVVATFLFAVIQIYNRS